MTATTFKITLNLATPIIMGRTRLTLDGLLSAAVFRKTGLMGSDCIPHIPLEQSKGIFKASSLFLDDSSVLRYSKVGRVMSLKGLNDLSVDHFTPNSANGKRYLEVDQARGKHKSTLSEYSALDLQAVCFYGLGDSQAVKELIETYITGIGMHSNSGSGQIINIETEQLEDDDLSFWLTESGKPARPLPIDIWESLLGADSEYTQNAAQVTVRFPYWDKDNLAKAVFPTEYTHF